MVWTLETNSPSTIGKLGGSGPNDVWLVDIGGIAMHTTGDGKWKYTTISSGTRLNGIQAFAPNDVYVSGVVNAIYHLDATGVWDHQVVTSGLTFTGLWGSGPNDIYAVGPGVLHSTGNRMWTTDMDTTAMFSVWGSAPGDLWTLDFEKYVHHRTPDGKWGTRQKTPLTSIADPVQIWGTGPTDIYALDTFTLAHSKGDGSWTVEPVNQDPHVQLECVWGSGPKDLYVGGFDSNIYRSVGDGVWYHERLPTPPNEEWDIFSIWGPSADDVYVSAVGGVFRGHPGN